MEQLFEEIRIRGKDTVLPAILICDRTTIVTGRWLRVARVKDEELVEGEVVGDPQRFVAVLKGADLKPDIFTFAQRPPKITPTHDCHFEWDNWAAVPITKFQDWWENRLPQESRKNVRRSAKRGVVVKCVPFSDELVRGIQRIYNETEVRQGRRFWHFGKNLEAVKRMNETYLERSDFIGAFLGDELIGFVKIVHVDDTAHLMQIIAMNEHHDKRPMNALVARAVEACVQRKTSLLVYGKYAYGNRTDSSLAEFKRRNGFEQITFPRYYVPLSLKGRLAIGCGLHLGVANLLPSRAKEFLLTCRTQFYEQQSQRGRSIDGL